MTCEDVNLVITPDIERAAMVAAEVEFKVQGPFRLQRAGRQSSFCCHTCACLNNLRVLASFSSIGFGGNYTAIIHLSYQSTVHRVSSYNPVNRYS